MDAERENVTGKDGNNVFIWNQDDWLDHETKEECVLRRYEYHL
jgi:hypothetical protein